MSNKYPLILSATAEVSAMWQDLHIVLGIMPAPGVPVQQVHLTFKPKEPLQECLDRLGERLEILESIKVPRARKQTQEDI